MTLTSLLSKRLFLGLVFSLSLFPVGAFAQGSLSLSVSPTLFDMLASPDQEWTSTVKVINTNPFDLEVTVEVVNFEPQGESGQGRFLPIDGSGAAGTTFAEWISVTERQVIIPAEQTAQIPFTISVPTDAAPGGHFAAMLIGTQSPVGEDGELQVQTAQVVTSLLFLRVSGDIVEDGRIREFRTIGSVYESPEVDFEMRFENRGNVHIQPQGDIKIFNMWGQERGVIPVNRRSLFGNVLPDSIRKYSFTWSGEWSIADIGRYTAVATLAYGDEARQFSTSETTFWVIPWRVLGGLFLVLGAFIWLFVWAIKLYVRKMLQMAGVSPELQAAKPKSARVSNRVSVVAPIEEGMLDLRSSLSESTSWGNWFSILLQMIRKYRIFLIVLFAVVVFIYLVVSYISSASETSRNYQVTIDGINGDINLTSEEIEYDSLRSENPQMNQNTEVKEFPNIQIINRSGEPGLAAEVRLKLETAGYEVQNLDTDFGISESRTVIVYNPEAADEALELSQFLGNALLSAYIDTESSQYPISIYVGQDAAGTIE